MESNIQSSFIPHDAGTPVSARRGSSGGIGDLALMFAILLFAAAGALSVAVFIYNQYETTIAAKDLSSLKQAEGQIQPDLIDQLQRLDDRIHAGQTILAAHTAPSVFFDIFDQVTAKTIAYNSLQFDASDPSKILLTMDGVGKSVNSIAFQADLLAKSGAFIAPIFSNLDHQKDGVHFHVTAQLDPKSISFEQLTSSSGSGTGGTSAAPSTPAQPSAPPAPSAPASPFGGSPQAGQ